HRHRSGHRGRRGPRRDRRTVAGRTQPDPAPSWQCGNPRGAPGSRLPELRRPGEPGPRRPERPHARRGRAGARPEWPRLRPGRGSTMNWLIPLPVVVPLVGAGLALAISRRSRAPGIISVAALSIVLAVVGGLVLLATLH